MHPFIEEHREAIRALCREYGVQKLELFGSAATDAFDPEHSDVDFIVHYPEDYDFGPWLARYFELRDRLQTLLGRPVDLVMASAIRKPRFIRAANQTRQVMFDASAVGDVLPALVQHDPQHGSAPAMASLRDAGGH